MNYDEEDSLADAIREKSAREWSKVVDQLKAEVARLKAAGHEGSSCSMLAARLNAVERERDAYRTKLTRLGDCSPQVLASNPPQVRVTKAEWDRTQAEVARLDALLQVDCCNQKARAEKAEAEVARLKALFQQTHGCHVSWVAEADKRGREAALRAAIKEHAQCTHECVRCGHNEPCATDDVCRALTTDAGRPVEDRLGLKLDQSIDSHLATIDEMVGPSLQDKLPPGWMGRLVAEIAERRAGWLPLEQVTALKEAVREACAKEARCFGGNGDEIAKAIRALDLSQVKP